MTFQGDSIEPVKARLFSNAFAHAVVRWNSAEKIEIISSHGIDWIGSGELTLKEICSVQELTKFGHHFSIISDQPAFTFFKCRKEIKEFSIYCSSQQIGEDKLSMWMILPDNDQSINLLQNAVHDIKSPINSILGIVNLMQHCINENFNIEDLKMYIDLIRTTANKSANLVNEVMDLAEMESAEYQLETEKIFIPDFIRTYINTHRLLTIKKKITVQFESSISIYAPINKVKMTRVFDNIMSNAIKFSPANSTIYFEILEDNTHTFKIAIRDEGIGIPEAIKDQLFVKFGNAKRKGLDGEISSGLGMSIVKQIMELHNGKVVIESKENSGTTVFLHLNKG